MTTDSEARQELEKLTAALRERLLAEGFSGEELERKVGERLIGLGVVGVGNGYAQLLTSDG